MRVQLRGAFGVLFLFEWMHACECISVYCVLVVFVFQCVKGMK